MSKMAVMVAQEATHGTVGTTFVSVPADFDTELKQSNRVIDEGRQGQDQNFTMVQGRRFQEWSVKDSMVYHDSIGMFLLSALGIGAKVVAAGETIVWDHTFKFADDPRSLSMKWNQPMRSTQAYQVLNACVDKMTFKFDAEGDLAWSASGVSFGETAIAAPTYGFSSARPFAAWAGTVTLEGGAFANLRKGEVTITRNRKPFHTIANTQDPSKISIGARTIEYALTLDFVTTTSYDAFKAASAGAFSVLFEDAGVTLGVAANPEIEIGLGTIHHETAKVDVSGDLPAIDLKGKAVYDTSDASTGVVRVRSTRDYTTP